MFTIKMCRFRMKELFQKENCIARTGKEIFEHKKLFQWNKKTRYLEKKSC